MPNTDLFNTYAEFAEFIAPKLAEISAERTVLERKIKRTIKRYYTKYDQVTATFLKCLYAAGPVMTRYAEITKEFNHIKLEIIKSKLKYGMVTPEEAAPIRVAEAKHVSVSSVLGGITTRKSRDTYLCPLHAETSGSLKVYKNNSWYCFGCCQGGDTIDLVMKYYNLPFNKAVEWLT